jgi:putative membrane protein
MWMNMGQMGWGSAYGGMFGWAPMLVWWGVLILGIALVAKCLFGTVAGERRSGRSSAREILAERYARGEIDREEYERTKRDLNG